MDIFLDFLQKMHNVNPSLIESIKSGYDVIYESRDDFDYIETIWENIIREADRLNLPVPTSDIDFGSHAMVFDTTNPNIVCRIEHMEGDDSSDFQLMDSELQDSGGVVKIYGHTIISTDESTYLITWKEKIDQNFEHVLYKKYGNEIATTIIGALHLYYNVTEEQVNILKKYPETKGLYNAIMKGLPTRDLAPEQNLGITKKKKIVAFDV